MKPVLPSSCFAPTLHFALLANAENYTIEAKENFVKQSFRSRYEIYAANGKLSLVVPLKKWKNHTPIEKMELSFDENWQQLHWRSIESAYRASPYFEYYDEEIKPLVFSKEPNLITRNNFIEQQLLKLLKIKSESHFSESYEAHEPDWRKIIHPKNKIEKELVSFPKYIQVFEEKEGFLPNLSILDLIFNLGPESKTYLNRLNTLIHHGKKN